jgi:SSS family solute:Na+ symporter
MLPIFLILTGLAPDLAVFAMTSPSPPVFAAADGRVTTVDSSLQDAARRELLRAVREESKWVKVHAADALLLMPSAADTAAEVRTLFQAEENASASEPRYRIGVWRVLARASESPQGRAAYVDKVLRCYLDPDGPDRLHAVETLCKLGLALPAETCATIDGFRADPPDAMETFRLGVLANAGRKDAAIALGELLRLPEPRLRALAGYALRHVTTPLPDSVVELLDAPRLEDADPLQQAQLLTAACFANRGGRGGGQHAPRLFSLATAEPTTARYEVAAGLAYLGGAALEGQEERMSLLGKLLRDTDADVRVAASQALLQIARRADEAGQSP